MKFTFAKGSPQSVLEEIKDALGGRKLADMLDFNLSDDSLLVTISKLGKSTLNFDIKEKDKGFEWVLVKEKIAFSHKAFKGEVLSKIKNVIEKIGGEVS